MDEIEPFIKRARTTLGANGAKFVEYIDFLKEYKKDNNKDFEQEAWQAGYENGRHAISENPEFFEMNGNLIRRADTQNIGHILAAVASSKSKKKKPTRRPANQVYRPAYNSNYNRPAAKTTAYRPAPPRPNNYQSNGYRPTASTYNRQQNGFSKQPSSYRTNGNDEYPSRNNNRQQNGYGTQSNGYQSSRDNYSTNNYQQNGSARQSNNYQTSKKENYSSHNYQTSAYNSKSNAQNYGNEDEWYEQASHSKSNGQNYGNEEEYYSQDYYSNERGFKEEDEYYNQDYYSNERGFKEEDEYYNAQDSYATPKKEEPYCEDTKSCSTIHDPDCDYRTGEPYYVDEFDSFLKNSKEDRYEHDDRQPDIKSQQNNVPEVKEPEFDPPRVFNSNAQNRKEASYYQHDNRQPANTQSSTTAFSFKKPQEPVASSKPLTGNSASNNKSTESTEFTAKSLFPTQTVGKFDKRTLNEVIEYVGETIFHMIQDIHNQGLKKFLRHDTLHEIIKKHKFDSSFSLNKLKCFLALYLSNYFHISAGNENSVSVKSKAEAPKSKDEIVHPLLPKKVKEQQIHLNEHYSCQILGADQKENSLLIYLSPYLWKSTYCSLVEELRRYASMVPFLQPLDYVFKSDRILYFDKESRRFYRGVALSEKDQGKIEVFLSDEFQKCKVDINNLYKMPIRFYKYHDMAFTLKIENNGATNKLPELVECFRKCVPKDHIIEISVTNFDRVEDGASIYMGQFYKITQNQ